MPDMYSRTLGHEVCVIVSVRLYVPGHTTVRVMSFRSPVRIFVESGAGHDDRNHNTCGVADDVDVDVDGRRI